MPNHLVSRFPCLPPVSIIMLFVRASNLLLENVRANIKINSTNIEYRKANIQLENIPSNVPYNLPIFTSSSLTISKSSLTGAMNSRSSSELPKNLSCFSVSPVKRANLS